MLLFNLPTNRQHLSTVKNYLTIEHCAIAVFVVLCAVGIVNHEMWRDELQAWMLARDSASIGELWQNIKDEGHPALWHLCLYWLTQWTRNPLAMQLFHLIIATAVVCLFVGFAPFSRLHKALFAFGYFPLYEYALLSRNYAIGVFFMFCFCLLFSQRRRNYLLIAVVLALLANTNLYALLISFSLGTTLILDSLATGELRELSSRNRRVIASIAILAAGWLISLLQITRPLRSLSVVRPLEQMRTETITTVGTSIGGEIKRLALAICKIYESHLPIPNVFRVEFWNSHLLQSDRFFPRIGQLSVENILALIISLLIVIVFLRFFARQPLILFTYISGTSGLIVFEYLVLEGVNRHCGHLFILLLVCLWLAEAVGTRQTVPVAKVAASNKNAARVRSQGKLRHCLAANSLLSVILFAQVVSGVFAYSIDLKYPFSAGREVAEFIEERHWENLAIVGKSERKAATLSGYLDRQIHYPESHRLGSFWTTYSPQSDTDDLEDTLETAQKLLQRGDRQVLVVLSSELAPVHNIKFDAETLSNEVFLTEVARFDRNVITDEKFYLYLASNNAK